MKKQILFFAVAVLIGHVIYTFNPKETLETPLPFATHALIILLDDSEIKIGAVASELIVALSQKAAPILVSASLFAAIENTPTIAELIQEQPTNTLYTTLQTRYKNVIKRIPELITSNQPLSLDDKKAIVAQLNKEFPEISEITHDYDNEISMTTEREAFSFNSDEWIIKIADHEKQLLLLIPKDYTNDGTSIDLKQYKPRTKKLNTNDPLTEIEYKTGLKIDHMETIANYIDALPEEFAPKEYADYFMQAVWPRKMGANCSDLFVSNAEYREANLESPQWAIYAGGHGEVQKKSIGLTLDMFKQFLDFMNIKIRTSIFVYISCFAAGTNMQLIYQDEKKLAKTYSFIIITQGIVDSGTGIRSAGLAFDVFELEDIDFINKKLEISPYKNFVKFFKTVTTDQEITDFESTVSSLLSLELKQKEFLEVPHIRFKGRDFFSLYDLNHKIAIIGNIFAKTCTTVDITKYFTKNGIVPTYYLIYAPIIPCELIISSLADHKPYFIPMFTPEVGDSSIFEYHIQKITAPHLSLSDIITTFTTTIPDFSYVHVQIDDLSLKIGSLFSTKEHVIDSLKDVFIKSEAQDSEYAQQSKQFNLLNEEFNKLMKELEKAHQETNLLVKKYHEKHAQNQFTEAFEINKKATEKLTLINEINAQLAQISSQMTQSANKLTQLEQKESKNRISCYFVYNNVPYKLDTINELATPLTQDYRDTLKKTVVQPDRFEAISEFQKKHIRLQKLRNTQTTD